MKRVTDIVRRYESAFIKFDGFAAGCEAEGHGHLRGPYAVEANVDAYIELFDAVREAAAAIEHLGIIVINPEKWEDNAMMVLGRDARLLTLYIRPELLRQGERDWAFLASILEWAKHNAGTLQHTEMLPGDAFKREVHGYAHFAGDRGIIALRNPSTEPQEARVKLDETTGWSRSDELGPPGSGTAFIARIVYPREETLGKTSAKATRSN